MPVYVARIPAAPSVKRRTGTNWHPPRRMPYSSGVHLADTTPRKSVRTIISFRNLRLFLFCRLSAVLHRCTSGWRRRALENKSEILSGYSRLRMTKDTFGVPYVPMPSTSHIHFLICSGNGHCEQSESLVLQAKVFVDLEQPLLVRDRAQKFFLAGIISKKMRRSGFGRRFITAPATSRIRSKAVGSASREVSARPSPRMETARWRGCPQTRFTDQRHLLW